MWLIKKDLFFFSLIDSECCGPGLWLCHNALVIKLKIDGCPLQGGIVCIAFSQCYLKSNVTCFRLVQLISGLKHESCLGHNTGRDCSKKGCSKYRGRKAQKLIPHTVVVKQCTVKFFLRDTELFKIPDVQYLVHELQFLQFKST